jgi:cyclomaltodextrinase
MVEDFPTTQARGSRAALVTLLLVAGCGTAPTSEPAAGRLDVPAWAPDVIWYQIFVERFRNGDPSNDPTAHDIAGVTDEAPPNGWRPTP